MRTNNVSKIHADVVCENDVFVYDRGEITEHSIDFRKPRGDVYAAYALIKMKDGSEKCEVLSRDEIEVIRNRSRAGKSGPWVTDWNEMAKKTAFRRVSKWVPLSAEIRDAISEDDRQFEAVVDGVVSSPRISSLDDLTASLEDKSEPEEALEADSSEPMKVESTDEAFPELKVVAAALEAIENATDTATVTDQVGIAEQAFEPLKLPAKRKKELLSQINEASKAKHADLSE